MPSYAASRAFTGSHLKGKDEEARRILHLVQQGQTAKADLAEEWFHAITFTRGNQWTYLDPDGGGVQFIPRVPWRIRVTDNQTLPLVTHMTALLLQNRPIFQAIARNDEEEDILAAYGYEALLRYDWQRLRMTNLLSRSLNTALITGNYFWKASWNPDAGRAVLVPGRVGEDLAGAKGAPKAEKKEVEGDEAEVFELPPIEGYEPTPLDEMVHEGDIDVRGVSPFNFGVELTATDLRKAAYCWEEAYVSREVLVEKFGAKAKDLKADVTAGEYQAYDRRLRFDSQSDLMSEDASDLVRVIEFHDAPSKKNREGKITTLAGGVTLDQRKNPYGGRFPYVHFACLPVEGRFWADGIVRHLVPLQQMHNRAVSRYHEIMNLSANPKVIADYGSGLKETAINDQPGEVIFKKRGSQVNFVTPPPPSPIHPQIMSLAMNAMQTITGVNDPLAGANPPNVRAAATVRALQESGMRRFLPIALNIEDALTQAGQMLLYLHKRFYSEERAVQILGSNGRPEVHHLKKADIERISDVTIEHGSMMPKSAAAQQESLIQLMQFAPFLLTDEEGQIDREHIFRILEMPTARGRISLDQRQRSRAYQEHVDCEKGEDIVVQPFDHDLLHMRLHGSRLSDDRWVRENPEAGGKLMEHYAEHEVQRNRKMSGEMADIYGGASPEGSAGPPGGGPQGPPPGGPPMPPMGPAGGGLP